MTEINRERTRRVEAEMKRIERLLQRHASPAEILNINEADCTNATIDCSYRKIVLLIHPDKNFSHHRFVSAFQFVTESRNSLKMPGIIENQNESNSLETPRADAISITHTELQVFQNSVSRPTIPILLKHDTSQLIPLIHQRQSEHSKNKRPSSKDKHEKGIRQKKTQKRAAQKRLSNQNFSFCPVERKALTDTVVDK